MAPGGPAQRRRLRQFDARTKSAGAERQSLRYWDCTSRVNSWPHGRETSPILSPLQIRAGESRIGRRRVALHAR